MRGKLMHCPNASNPINLPDHRGKSIDFGTGERMYCACALFPPKGCKGEYGSWSFLVPFGTGMEEKIAGLGISQKRQKYFCGSRSRNGLKAKVVQIGRDWSRLLQIGPD